MGKPGIGRKTANAHIDTYNQLKQYMAEHGRGACAYELVHLCHRTNSTILRHLLELKQEGCVVFKGKRYEVTELAPIPIYSEHELFPKRNKPSREDLGMVPLPRLSAKRQEELLQQVTEKAKEREAQGIDLSMNTDIVRISKGKLFKTFSASRIG